MKRLFDDPGMPPELRTDLLRSRHAGRDYDALAKLPQLRSALSDSSRQTGDTLSSADTGLHIAPWTWKLAVLVAIGGGALFAAWPAQRDTQPERPAITQPEPAAVATTAPIAPIVEPVEDTPAPASAELPAQPAKAPRAAAASSRREIDQLQRIRATLERDPAAAYRLAQRSEQEFPNGVLSEERQALQVVALAKSGEADAAARRARQFFARYPQSPLRELLESALKP